MTVRNIINSNDHADYLEHIGMNVERLEDGRVKVWPGEDRYIIVSIEDIPNIIGEVYRSNTSVEEVFEEYVIERGFEQ